MEIEKVKGIGEVRAKQYSRLGIASAEQLIRHIPQKYENRGNILPLSLCVDGEKHACILTVATVARAARISGGRTILKFRAFDSSAAVEIAFFCKNVHAVKKYDVGTVLRVYGRFFHIGKQLSSTNPICEEFNENIPLPELYPIYKTTAGLSSKIISKHAESAFESIKNTCSLFDEYLPESIFYINNILPIQRMYHLLHFPESEKDIAEARRCICYREFFLFFCMTALQKNARLTKKKTPMCVELPQEEISQLPFELTNGQKQAILDIYRDLSSEFIMRRIVVGDVGCGKTEIARFAALMAIKAGNTVAIMAPTEILASQHSESLSAYFESKGYPTALILGSTPAKEKREIRRRLALPHDNPEKILLIIGTHALLTENVKFSDLGLVIIDEQHRFGVVQRQKLIDKGDFVNSLSLSATPIPRSYAKMLYGDTDSSIVSEMPPGRTPPKTFVVNEGYRERLNGFIEKKVAEGRQVYVVCPAIEPSEDDDEYDTQKAKDLSAETRYQLLSEHFPNLKTDILHGKMRPKEKSEAMERFSRGETQILVSTTVIEVGVNVPNATLMIIEGADRFGLSQLHQLRGRVARGTHECFCVLVSDSTSTEATERLRVLAEHSSGFDVAEEDFKQRGPGDLFAMTKSGNIRQSGEFGFKYAEFCNDEEIMRKAYEDAQKIMATPDAFDADKLLKTLEEYTENGLSE